ncbi:MAG: hypothetical protein IJL64_00775 [Bacteroidales bacterium]|nr:hypothetical protein [Bacteroidales bacterium]
MKKILGTACLLAVLLTALPAVSRAQDEYVKAELEGYYKELVELNNKIVTAEDADRYENTYKAHIKLVESCYSDYSEIIRYQKNLHQIYVNYTDLYQQIGKHIEELKAARAQQEVIDKLSGKFDTYLARLQVMQQQAERYVANKRIDSLKLVKKEAEEYFNSEATVEYNSNRQIFDDNEALAATWNAIKDTYTRISATDIISKSLSDMIFKIITAAAMVFIAFNMVMQKMKIKKQLKKAQTSQQPQEELPSI